jgi:hypothetical protein
LRVFSTNLAAGIQKIRGYADGMVAFFSLYFGVIFKIIDQSLPFKLADVPSGL